jgi:hypothetical protein
MAFMVTELMVKPERPVGVVFHHWVWLPFSLAMRLSPQSSTPVVVVQFPEKGVLPITIATLLPPPQPGVTVGVGEGRGQLPSWGRSKYWR